MDMLTTRRIVLLGKQGAGKSSLANTLFGEDVFEMKHTSICGTSECQAGSKSVHGRLITLVDTPGPFDADRPEEELKREIVRCITVCAPGPHAFFIVLKVEKFTKQEQAVITEICQYFSEEVFKYATVVFTHGDQLDEGQTIEDFVRKNTLVSDLVKKCGDRCHVVDNKYWKNNQQDEYRSNKFQVAELLNTTDKIVMENKGGCYTKKMLQAVRREVEEEGNRTSAGKMPRGGTSNKTNNTVSKNVWIKLTGPAAESLEGAFFWTADVVLQETGVKVAEEVVAATKEAEDVATETKKEAEKGGRATVGGGLKKFIGSLFWIFSAIAAVVGGLMKFIGSLFGILSRWRFMVVAAILGEVFTALMATAAVGAVVRAVGGTAATAITALTLGGLIAGGTGGILRKFIGGLFWLMSGMGSLVVCKVRGRAMTWLDLNMCPFRACFERRRGLILLMLVLFYLLLWCFVKV